MKKFKTIAQLFRARSRWIQGDMARTKEGPTLVASDARCFCWCLMGATHKVYGGSSFFLPRRMKAVNKLAESIKELFPRRRKHNVVEPGGIIVDFNDNDHTTIADIRAVVRHAGV